MDHYDEQENQPILAKRNNPDWEQFKKMYYSQENQIQAALESLNKTHSETCKKLEYLDDTEFQNNEIENKQRLNTLDIAKMEQQIQAVSDMMGKLYQEMSQILQNANIDQNEAQVKLKQNILKRFKEIHQEHEKELQRTKNSFEYNINKYKLFKETIKKPGSIQKQNYNRDEIRYNRSLNSAMNQTDSIIEMARGINTSFANQGSRLNSIQGRVSELIGNFINIDMLIVQIRRKKMKSQILLLILAVFLGLFILYKIFQAFI